MVKNGLNDSHFDAVVEDIVETLKALNVSQPDIDEVVRICDSTRADVLDR